jgi:hypothetical protein
VIAISTNDGTRTYRVPRALAEAAVAVTGESDVCDAVFSLARRLTAADFHTTECIALNATLDEAVQFARERLVQPKARWLKPVAPTAVCC